MGLCKSKVPRVQSREVDFKGKLYAFLVTLDDWKALLSRCMKGVGEFGAIQDAFSGLTLNCIVLHHRFFTIWRARPGAPGTSSF